MMAVLRRWLGAIGMEIEERWLGAIPHALPLGRASQPEAISDGAKLVVHFELFVDARCPCGSLHLHRLTLYSTSDCARCGRTIGVRSIEYHRTAPSLRPEPYVSIGYVTAGALTRLPTHGVH